jgi:acetylornithine/N-succinyldiaminopimelate aminotransferase
VTLHEPSVMPTYGRFPLTLVRGAGTRVWDEAGREYLDFAGALGVSAIGHSHPAWLAAVTKQAATLDMVSNLFGTEPQAELAARLASLLPIRDAQVFFANSGAEANEAAIKLARRHGLASGRPTIVALEGSFHGRTVATLAATGQPTKREVFEPLVDWFRFVPPGDLAALEAAMTLDVAAVLLEPVMGEGGVLPLAHAYLQGVRALCDERGALLIADEVQSGMGRCGDWLAISRSGVVPDVVTLAKALGGGLPIGALVTRAELAFGPGEHASTFGGGPIVCAGALAVLDVIETEGLLARGDALGDLLSRAVSEAADDAFVTDVRGRGCLWGIQLDRPIAHGVALSMLEAGVLVSIAGPDVVRMSPPLIATEDDVRFAVSTFTEALAGVAVALGSDVPA